MLGVQTFGDQALSVEGFNRLHAFEDSDGIKSVTVFRDLNQRLAAEKEFLRRHEALRRDSFEVRIRGVTDGEPKDLGRRTREQLRQIWRELRVYPDDQAATIGWLSRRLANRKLAWISSSSRLGISLTISSGERPSARKIQDVADSDAHPTDAGTSTTLLPVYRDAIRQLSHDVLPLYSQSSLAPDSATRNAEISLPIRPQGPTNRPPGPKTSEPVTVTFQAIEVRHLAGVEEPVEAFF